MVRKSLSEEGSGRPQPNLREAILPPPEDMFSTYGFTAVSVRGHFAQAGRRPIRQRDLSFQDQGRPVLEIYRVIAGRERRRSELLAAAIRVRNCRTG